MLLKSPVSRPKQGLKINVEAGGVNYSSEFNTVRTTDDMTHRMELCKEEEEALA